mmetsp:Transcript_48545/g.125959  ORF Transcript_48545/g.125959 Transcript_48545/m.125959 type:complete len:99 (+) Transcript_48545:564-860(+)
MSVAGDPNALEELAAPTMGALACADVFKSSLRATSTRGTSFVEGTKAVVLDLSSDLCPGSGNTTAAAAAVGVGSVFTEPEVEGGSGAPEPAVSVTFVR